MDLNIALRIASLHKEDFLNTLTASANREFIEVTEVKTWRSDPSYFNVLVALTSTGSVAILARLIREWILRKKGSIEVINTRTGVKIKYTGLLTEVPIKDILGLLSSEEENESPSAKT